MPGVWDDLKNAWNSNPQLRGSLIGAGIGGIGGGVIGGGTGALAGAGLGAAGGYYGGGALSDYIKHEEGRPERALNRALGLGVTAAKGAIVDPMVTIAGVRKIKDLQVQRNAMMNRYRNAYYKDVPQSILNNQARMDTRINRVHQLQDGLNRRATRGRLGQLGIGAALLANLASTFGAGYETFAD
jgi:hypothetical protein